MDLRNWEEEGERMICQSCNGSGSRDFPWRDKDGNINYHPGDCRRCRGTGEVSPSDLASETSDTKPLLDAVRELAKAWHDPTVSGYPFKVAIEKVLAFIIEDKDIGRSCDRPKRTMA